MIFAVLKQLEQLQIKPRKKSEIPWEPQEFFWATNAQVSLQNSLGLTLFHRSHSETIGPRERRQKVFTRSSHFARFSLSMVLVVVYWNECFFVFLFFVFTLSILLERSAFPKLS